VTRIGALLRKELMDLRQNPGIFYPAILTGLVALMLPFILAIGIPQVTGERLSDSSDSEVAVEMYRTHEAARALSPEGAVQAWIFQQFLVLLALSPIAASMSVAAFSVIGEKQARTLEPLLATPLTTFELLAAKVLGSLVPALALAAVTFVLYVAAMAVVAEPGVAGMMMTAQPVAVMFLLSPLAALAALQLAVCVSSRVNDPRSAQQIGALIVLPLAGLLVLQLTGAVLLTMPLLLVIAAVLAGVNAGLMWLGIRLFDRESILTRWT
jgi:ABC-2 type transport system permease protein